jgi:hypothetical protein
MRSLLMCFKLQVQLFVDLTGHDCNTHHSLFVSLSLVSNAADIEVATASGLVAAHYLAMCMHALVAILVKDELLYLGFQLLQPIWLAGNTSGCCCSS